VCEFGNNKIERWAKKLDEMREDGRVVGGEVWHEKVYNR
jgi:hypothetical protein